MLLNIGIGFVAWIAAIILFIAVRFYRTLHTTRQPPPIPVHPLLTLSTVEISKKLRAGECTSLELVNLSIEVIEKVNPYLNAMVFDRFELAREEAKAADALLAKARQRKDAHSLPWLTGIPCTIKECIAVEGCPQSSGVVARKEYRCPEDAIQVKRLKAAGAIVLGVTNLSQLCMWMESTNFVYGTTNNAYDTARIVGGSSGGEGCAQSAYFGFFGLGSDIGGSIRMPSYFNGVFGHKPSTRLVPNIGQYPCTADKGHFLLCTGPICRHAEDLYPLLETLATGGFDASLPAKLYPRPPGIATMNPEKVKLSKLKIYCIQELPLRVLRASKEQKLAARRAAEELQRQFGCQLHMVDWRDKSTVPKGWDAMKYAPDIWQAMASADSASFTEMMAEGYAPGQYRPWKELLLNILGLSDKHTLPAAALAAIETIQEKLFSAKRCEELIAMGRQLQKDVEVELGSTGVIVVPTFPNTVPKHYRPLFLPVQWVYTALFNALQSPATAVPIWLDRSNKEQKLPLGVQVVSSWGNDGNSLAVARALEQIFGGYRPPTWAVGSQQIDAAKPQPVPTGPQPPTPRRPSSARRGTSKSK